jgi:hypothetical protein
LEVFGKFPFADAKPESISRRERAPSTGGGAGGRTRTVTPLRIQDFESCAKASATIQKYCLNLGTIGLNNHFFKYWFSLFLSFFKIIAPRVHQRFVLQGREKIAN